MPIIGYKKFQALNAATGSPWTRDLRHTTAVFPRYWSLRVSYKDPTFKPARVKDRIKWWNVVPGDQVRVLGWKDSSVREVFRINRLSNRVYLKNEKNDEEDSDGKGRTDSVHYSRCQLFVGKHKFPPLAGESEPRILPVFAVRVGMTTPMWSQALHRYCWDRYAESTVPRLPGWIPGSKDQVRIPWPQSAKREPQKPTAYDTPLEAVAEVTYTPPPIPSEPKVLAPKLSAEHDYIKSLTKSTTLNFPVEVYVTKELCNPHSRANIQKRWQERQEYKKELLETMIRRELNNLQGRTRREAKAEATWKWKESLEEERKAELRRKWLGARIENARNKRARQEKKQERINRKLRELVLEDSANQKVPDQPTTSL